MRSRRAEFWKRERADGSLGDVWWTNLHGRRVTTGQASLENAKAWKRGKLRDGADPRGSAAQKATLEDAVREMYAELHRRGRTAGTQQRCRTKLAHFPRLWGAGCKLAHIDARKVSSYIDARLADSLETTGFKTPKRITIRDELAFLRQTLKLARKQGLYPYAIDDVMPDAFETGHSPKKDWVTEENLPKLIAEVAPHRAAHLLFFVVTAGRLADSFRALPEDFDTTKWRVRVRGSKTEKSDRTITVEPFLRKWVKRLLALAEPENGLLFRPWGKIWRDLSAACDRAGIPRVSSNGLRRTFGKWHRIRGYSPDFISKLFGHTTPKLALEVYADVEGDELAALAESERYKTRTRSPKTTKKPRQES